MNHASQKNSIPSASAMMGARIVRVKCKRGDSGYYFATSDDLTGLVVSAETPQNLHALIPGVITKLYAACGVEVIVTGIENGPSEMGQKWVAMPAEIARQELEKSSSL